MKTGVPSFFIYLSVSEREGGGKIQDKRLKTGLLKIRFFQKRLDKLII